MDLPHRNAQSYKFSNKNDLFCACSDFNKTFCGISTCHKWMFKQKISSIFNFDQAHQSWISVKKRFWQVFSNYFCNDWFFSSRWLVIFGSQVNSGGFNSEVTPTKMNMLWMNSRKENHWWDSQIFSPNFLVIHTYQNMIGHIQRKIIRTIQMCCKS